MKQVRDRDEKLKKLVSPSSKDSGEVKPNLNGNAKKEMPQKLSFETTAEDILKLKITEIPKLLDPILQKKGLGFISGGSDSGKSYFCLHLALAICSGDKNFLDYKLNQKHKSVIIVCTEDNEEEICCRLTPLTNGKTFNTKELRFIFETDDVQKKLKQALKQRPADLIIIDTFGDLFSGSINNSIEVRAFLKDFKLLAKEFNCLVLFNHHIGKGKENNKNVSKNDLLGSQAIESASRIVLVLKKEDDSSRVLTVVKGNNLSEDLKKKGLILDFSTINGFSVSTKKSEIKCKNDEGIDQAIELYKELKSYRQVAEMMTKRGIKMDKNKVSSIVKEHCPSLIIPRVKIRTDK